MEKQYIYKRLEDLRSTNTQQELRALRRELRSHTRKWDKSSEDAPEHGLVREISDQKNTIDTEYLHTWMNATEKSVPSLSIHHALGSSWTKISACASSISARSFPSCGFSVKFSGTKEAKDMDPPVELVSRLKRSLADSKNQRSFVEPKYTAEYGVVAQMLQRHARSTLFRRRLSELYLINAAQAATDDIELVVHKLAQLLDSIHDDQVADSDALDSNPGKLLSGVLDYPAHSTAYESLAGKEAG